MTVVKVLIGVAGVGKSTYIQKVKTEKSLVLSSDELRIELFGSLEAGNQPEAIYQHMKAHDGISEKAIKKDKLDADTVALIEDFAKIDSASRVIDEVIYEKYISLLVKKG